mgnify:FL=1
MNLSQMSNKEIIYDEYCAGKCPKCMSENIDYHSLPEEDGDTMSYASDCGDCGLKFFEYYAIKYEHSYGIEFINNSEENPPVIGSFDKNGDLI